MTKPRHRVRMTVDEDAMDAHWSVPRVGRAEIPEELIETIERSFGVTMERRPAGSGVFGNTYTLIGTDGLVVKVSGDWLEAGTSEWIRKQQSARKSKSWFTAATRAAFPRVRDVVALEGSKTSDFLASLSAASWNKRKEQRALYATLREDTISDDEARTLHGDELGNPGPDDLHDIVEPLAIFGGALRQRVESGGLEAVERSLPSDVEYVARRIDTAYRDSEIEDVRVRDVVLFLLDALVDLAEHGVLIADLHGDNIRWRWFEQGNGWPNPLRPLVADYGMSAMRATVGIRAVAANPPRLAWVKPRVVRV